MCFDKEIWEAFNYPKKPKTKIEAWVYLCGLFQANNNSLKISYGELAKQLLWSRVEVLRFLKKLQQLGKIELTSTTKYTIIKKLHIDTKQTEQNIQQEQQEQILEIEVIDEPTTQFLNKKRKSTHNKKAILFQETQYFYDKDAFIRDFTIRFPEYADYDLPHYHKSAQNWGQGSSANKYKKKDWILTIKTWIDYDEKRGKAVKKNNIPFVLMQTQNSLQKSLEYVKNNPL